LSAEENLTEKFEAAAALVGAQLAQARREAKLTQTEVGKRLGMQQTSIARIESGKTNASLRTLMKVADAIGCEIDITIR
jgi:transcriptional regulator with XRE-family HTH domain